MNGRWKSMTYFALNLPNRPGELACFAAQLRDAGINLLALWGYAPQRSDDRTSRISCVPESAEVFRLFFKSSGLHMEEGRTFYLCADDRPGALVTTLQQIAQAGINIQAIESLSAGGRFGCFLWADEKDHAALESLLNSA